jgi:sarcosine oxidase delta subunit
MNQQTNLAAAPLELSSMLTTAQAAAFLNVAKNTMEKWRLIGGGPAFIKLSRHCVRYLVSDLEAFVAKHRGYSTGEIGPG